MNEFFVLKKQGLLKILNILMLALLLANTAFLFWYVFVGYQANFHSDSAAKVLLAREIYETKSYFPKEWNHVNSDLFVVFGHIFIIPLLAFMPAGFTAHAISGAVFSGLILHGVWLLTGLAPISAWRRIAVVAVFASGISSIIAENLYGQVSYGVVLLLCCYLVYFASKYLSSNDTKKLRWSLLLVILFSLVYWANPKRAVVTYSLPLFISLAWLISSSAASNWRSFFKLAGLGLIGAAVGSVLHMATISDVNNIVGVSNARWLSYELIIRNVTLSLKGVYAQLGGLPLTDAPLFSIGGLYAGMRFGVASLVLVLMPIAISRAVSNRSDTLKFFALFAASSLLLTLYLQIMTTIPDMSDPIQSSRYMVPGMMLCFIILLVSELRWSSPPIWMISISLVLLVFASSAYNTYRLATLNSETLAQPGQINPRKKSLVAFLSEKNLRYGYASYWNAGALTVVSNEKSKVRQIRLNNGLPIPMRHLSSDRWYRPAVWQGKTFLLLRENEVELVNWRLMEQLGVMYEELHRIDGFLIFVFPVNIARLLPGWDTRYEELSRFPLTERALKNVGHLQKQDAGKGYILIANRGEVGALHYGPYLPVKPGRYRVTFDVLADHNPDGAVRIDVAGGLDQKIFGEKFLLESDAPQEIVFTLEEENTLEFRVWALGTEHVTFRGYAIQRLPD